MMARLACACHVAVLSFHTSTYPNLPRFPYAYPFLTDFRGQFWEYSGTQNGSWSISSESSRRPLSNGINFAWIGVRTRELWLPEVGVSELFLCTLPMKIPVKREMLLANREFHVVAGVVTFPTHPSSKINLLRVGKTLRAKAAVREKKRILLPAHSFSNLVSVRARFWPSSRCWISTFLVPTEILRCLLLQGSGLTRIGVWTREIWRREQRPPECFWSVQGQFSDQDSG